MTVGKLKEYLDDVDDNVEITGLRLYCENGFAIQSKTLEMDNSERIAELEELRKEISQMRDTFDLSCMNTFTLVIKAIDEHITKLKGENK